MEKITILGVGNILLSDEGFGVHVIEKMRKNYKFPDNVEIIDGGVLGFNLLNIILETDKLIVIDVARGKQKPGTFYRIAGKEIPERIKAKNSLHQLDFLETLTKCQAIGTPPETVILAIEPYDTETYAVEPTPELQRMIDPMIEKVLAELDVLGVKASLTI